MASRWSGASRASTAARCRSSDPTRAEQSRACARQRYSGDSARQKSWTSPDAKGEHAQPRVITDRRSPLASGPFGVFVGAVIALGRRGSVGDTLRPAVEQRRTMQFSLKRTQVCTRAVVLQLACNLGLLGFGPAASHDVDPLARMPGRYRWTGPHTVVRVIAERPRESRIFVRLTLHGESMFRRVGC